MNENVEIVAACGLSCPQPVLMTKKAIDGGATQLEVLVDNGAARENVTRFAKNAGFSVEVKEEDDTFHLYLKKSSR